MLVSVLMVLDTEEKDGFSDGFWVHPDNQIKQAIHIKIENLFITIHIKLGSPAFSLLSRRTKFIYPKYKLNNPFCCKDRLSSLPTWILRHRIVFISVYLFLGNRPQAKIEIKSFLGHSSWPVIMFPDSINSHCSTHSQ